jgi:hypothetical protein
MDEPVPQEARVPAVSKSPKEHKIPGKWRMGRFVEWVVVFMVSSHKDAVNRGELDHEPDLFLFPVI